jgi:hypothetical protein
MDQWNDELNGVFASYRAVVPDPEASANFMPELWRRIEGRRNLTIRFKKLTQIFMAAAAAMCLLFVTMLSVPAFSRQDDRGSYVDVLAEAFPTETLASHGIIPRDGFEANTK